MKIDSSSKLCECIDNNMAFEKPDTKGLFICMSNAICSDRRVISNGSVKTFFCFQSPIIEKLICSKKAQSVTNCVKKTS